MYAPYSLMFFVLLRFHGLGIDGQKGVKDLLRMESDDDGSDSELLDIENPSTPGAGGGTDAEENSSFHSGAADSPGGKDLKHLNNNNTEDASRGGVSPPPPSQEDRKPPVLDFSFLNGGLHNKSEDGAIRNWLKGTEGQHQPPPPPLGPIPGFPAGVPAAHAGLPHPHPLHPFLLPFSAFAAAAAAAAASAPPPPTSSHPPLFPPTAAAAAAASHYLANHSNTSFHVKDSV